MTREKAKEIIKNIDYAYRSFCPHEYEALEMAIKALEQEPCEDWLDVPSDEMTLEQARQAVKDLRKKLAEHLEKEPCEDCISRRAARKVILDEFEGWPTDEEVAQLKRMTKQIDELPPVTPQYTDAEIQKMQEMEQAEIQKAYEIGKYESEEI